MFITSPTFFHKLRHTIICIRYVGKAIVNKYLLIVTDFKNFFFIHFMYTYFSCRLLGSSVYPMDCLPHQAPLSMGFPRQEYWSGLPFPSPMHESKRWKWSRSVVSDSSDPTDCSLPGSSIHGILQARIRERLPLPSPT